MIAKVIDAILIAFIDGIFMYAFWLIGMATGVLDAAPSHWYQLFCTLPLFFIDGLTVVAAPAMLIYLNAAGAFPAQTSILANTFFITIICVNWLYFSVFESSPAQGTPGKIFMELAVVDPNGSTIGFLPASIRHFAKIISAVSLYLPLFGSDRKRCIHDAVSQTSVVVETV